MKQSKEVKGTVLCEKFNEKFADLVLISGNLKKVVCVRYKEERNIYLSDYMNLFKRSNVELEFFYDLTKTNLGNDYLFKFNAVDGSNFYTFHLSLTGDGEFYFSIDNNGIELDSYIFEFREEAFNSFFNFIQTEEENTSEPEQPEEDAEEPAEENKQEFEFYDSILMPLSVFQLMQNQVNDYIDKNDIIEKYGNKDVPCGITVEIISTSESIYTESRYKCQIYDSFDEEVSKSILNIEPLSPLERTVFEAIEDCFKRYNEYSELAKVAEYGAEYNGESAEEIVRYGHLANEQIFNSDYLKELISKAGLDETYQSWLRERKKQEAVTVI